MRPDPPRANPNLFLFYLGNQEIAKSEKSRKFSKCAFLFSVRGEAKRQWDAQQHLARLDCAGGDEAAPEGSALQLNGVSLKARAL